MKIVAILLLLVTVSGIALSVPWLFVPLLAGVAAAALVYLDLGLKPLAIRRLRAIAVLVIVGCLTFIFFWSSAPLVPVPASADSELNRNVATFIKPGSVSPSNFVSPLESDRLDLKWNLQSERRRVAAIEHALGLYNSARSELQRQADQPNKDLDDAMSRFRELFGKLRPSAVANSSNLLDPDRLDDHLAKVRAAINKLEEQTETLTDAQSIRRFRDRIPGVLLPYEIDELYSAVMGLQSKLDASVRVNVKAGSSYAVEYDAKNDQLKAIQTIRFTLKDAPAASANLAGFFNSKDGILAPGLIETLSIQEEGVQPYPVMPGEPEYHFRRGDGPVVVRMEAVRRSASTPLGLRNHFLSFQSLNLAWPLPSTQEINLSLRESANSRNVRPYTLRIENASDAQLEPVRLPRYSFYYSTPAIDKVSTTAESDEVFLGATGRLSSLSGTDRVLRLEILPWHLRNYAGQAIKEFLATENILAGLAIWAATVILAVLLKR